MFREIFARIRPKHVIVGLLLVAIAVCVCLLLFDAELGFKFSPFVGKGTETVEIGGESYRERKLTNILVIGTDETGKFDDSGADYRNLAAGDFLALVSVDKTAKTYSVLLLNRDMKVEIDEIGIGGNDGRWTGRTVNAQLALAHTYGNGGAKSCLNTTKAVSRLLYGLDIEYYVSLTMDGLAVANDFVGGVPIVIPDDYTVLDPEFTRGAEILLLGDQALRFVRARRNVDDGTNIARMERQHAYIDSFINVARAKNENDASMLSKLFEEMSPYICTNCSASLLDTFSGYIRQYRLSGLYTITGEMRVDNDGYVEIVNYEQSRDDIATSLFFEKKK